MNRYPLWKYLIVAVAIVLGLLYTLPNFFGESPAVQVSSGKATLKVDLKTLDVVENTLKTAGVEHRGLFLDNVGVKARFADEGTGFMGLRGLCALDGRLGWPFFYR